MLGQSQWCTPATPATGKLKWEGHEFQASLGNTA